MDWKNKIIEHKLSRSMNLIIIDHTIIAYCSQSNIKPAVFLNFFHVDAKQTIQFNLSGCPCVLTSVCMVTKTWKGVDLFTYKSSRFKIFSSGVFFWNMKLFWGVFEFIVLKYLKLRRGIIEFSTFWQHICFVQNLAIRKIEFASYMRILLERIYWFLVS